jgi:hypothetical protein
MRNIEILKFNKRILNIVYIIILFKKIKYNIRNKWINLIKKTIKFYNLDKIF